MSAVVDVRLVVQRDGRVRVVLEGRRVALPPADAPSGALAALARALDGAAWTSGRHELAEAQDAASGLYEVRAARGGARDGGEPMENRTEEEDAALDAGAQRIAEAIAAAGEARRRDRWRALTMLRWLVEWDNDEAAEQRAGWHAAVGIVGDILRSAEADIELHNLPVLVERVRWLQAPFEGPDMPRRRMEVARAALSIATGGRGWHEDVAHDLARLGSQTIEHDPHWIDGALAEFEREKTRAPRLDPAAPSKHCPE